MDSREIEARLIVNDAAAHNLKGKAYEIRMDRLHESMKTAKTPEDARRFSDLRKQTLNKYNKYRGTSHNN